VSVAGPVDPTTGFVVDYGDLKECVNTHVISKLDHTHLGCGEAFTRRDPDFRTFSIILQPYPAFGLDFYPSSENLVVALASILNPLISELAPNVRLFEIRLNETCTSSAVWRAPNAS